MIDAKTGLFSKRSLAGIEICFSLLVNFTFKRAVPAKRNDKRKICYFRLIASVRVGIQNVKKSLENLWSKMLFIFGNRLPSGCSEKINIKK